MSLCVVEAATTQVLRGLLTVPPQQPRPPRRAAHLHGPTHGSEHRASAGELRHHRHASGKENDAQDEPTLYQMLAPSPSLFFAPVPSSLSLSLSCTNEGIRKRRHRTRWCFSGAHTPAARTASSSRTNSNPHHTRAVQRKAIYTQMHTHHPVNTPATNSTHASTTPATNPLATCMQLDNDLIHALKDLAAPPDAPLVTAAGLGCQQNHARQD